jgi:hypothetical protein
VRLTKINRIGYASSIAANHLGSAEGPLKLQQSRAYKLLAKQKFAFDWQTILRPLVLESNKVSSVAELNKRLAKYTQKLVCDQLRFFTNFCSDLVSESVLKLARLSQKGLIFENRSAVYIKYMSSVAQKISGLCSIVEFENTLSPLRVLNSIILSLLDFIELCNRPSTIVRLAFQAW